MSVPPAVGRHTRGVLRLTDLTRRDALGPSGRHLGRLSDLSVRFDRPSSAFVTRFLLDHRGDILWSPIDEVDLESLAYGTVRVREEPTLGAVDGDVHLDHDELLLRRLGLQRLADREREQAVAWEDLHLTSDRGHLVQCGTEAALLHRLDAEQLAELLARVPSADAVEILDTVHPERAERALALSHPHVRSRLVRLRSTHEPAPPRWQRLRGWNRHRGPTRRSGPTSAAGGP